MEAQRIGAMLGPARKKFPMLAACPRGGSSARELLRWRQEELADRAGIAISTLRRLEGMRGPLVGSEETQARIVSALQGAGIEFSENGVRLK